MRYHSEHTQKYIMTGLEMKTLKKIAIFTKMKLQEWEKEQMKQQTMY